MHNVAFYTYQFTPMDLQYQQCWIGAMRLFVSHKLVAKLPATLQTTVPLIVTLPMVKRVVAILGNIIRYANQWFYLHEILLYTTTLATPLVLGTDFCMSYRNHYRYSIRQGHIVKYKLWTHSQSWPWTSLLWYMSYIHHWAGHVISII